MIFFKKHMQNSLLANVKTLAIVCNQWGDTGKGKFVDYFTPWADIIARGAGGANAGHTIIKDNRKIVVHLLPSSVLYDREGKVSIIGRGVAFDPIQCLAELREVNSFLGHQPQNLKISYQAKLVLPQHILMDRLRESGGSNNKIGTTGRGVGPCYTDFYARIGLTVNDMLHKDLFVKKFRKNLSEKMTVLRSYESSLIKNILNIPILENGMFFDEKNIINEEAIVHQYCEVYAKQLQQYISDTDNFLRENIGKKNVILEGAQGLLLSIDYGSYPYVTSSDPSIEGLVHGVGLKEKDVDMTLGIVKAFFMTRVGLGPFPTEFGGVAGEQYTYDNNQSSEMRDCVTATVNDTDELRQGCAIRIKGNEYGATTGRLRRVGWLDLTLLRYAIKVNGHDLILTKIDILDECNEIKICTAYEYIGVDYLFGGQKIVAGHKFTVAPMDIEILSACKPVYAVFPGWKRDITKMREQGELPVELTNILDFIEKETGAHVKILSVGAGADETIIYEEVKESVSAPLMLVS